MGMPFYNDEEKCEGAAAMAGAVFGYEEHT